MKLKVLPRPFRSLKDLLVVNFKQGYRLEMRVQMSPVHLEVNPQTKALSMHNKGQKPYLLAEEETLQRQGVVVQRARRRTLLYACRGLIKHSLAEEGVEEGVAMVITLQMIITLQVREA